MRHLIKTVYDTLDAVCVFSYFVGEDSSCHRAVLIVVLGIYNYVKDKSESVCVSGFFAIFM